MNGRLRTCIAAAAAVAAVAAGIGAASADGHSENVIKYRQNVMRAIGGHTGAISAVVKGEVEFTGHVAAHADSLAAMAGSITEMFPQGTESGADTRAKAEIWQDWDDFVSAAGDLETATANLAQVVNGGGDAAAIGDAFGEVGKACGGCHRPFRARAN